MFAESERFFGGLRRLMPVFDPKINFGSDPDWIGSIFSNRLDLPGSGFSEYGSETLVFTSLDATNEDCFLIRLRRLAIIAKMLASPTPLWWLLLNPIRKIGNHCQDVGFTDAIVMAGPLMVATSYDIDTGWVFFFVRVGEGWGDFSMLGDKLRCEIAHFNLVLSLGL